MAISAAEDNGDSHSSMLNLKTLVVLLMTRVKFVLTRSTFIVIGSIVQNIASWIKSHNIIQSVGQLGL